MDTTYNNQGMATYVCEGQVLELEVPRSSMCTPPKSPHESSLADKVAIASVQSMLASEPRAIPWGWPESDY